MKINSTNDDQFNFDFGLGLKINQWGKRKTIPGEKLIR